MKPNNKSQGQGIFLLRKVNQLKKIVPGANLNAAFKNFNVNETYVISRYLENPLLIGGKKFDLRIYGNSPIYLSFGYFISATEMLPL